MEPFDTFCSAVTDRVPNATRQEKAAIRQELAEHLEDHAAGLMETQGLSEEDAAEAAVAAMGDPQEIGWALNEKYSHLWRVLYLLCKPLAILCIVLAIYPFLSGICSLFGDIQQSVQAKHYVSQDEGVLPMDAEIAVGNQVLRLYGVKYDLYYDKPEIILYFLTYDRIPWHNASEDLILLLEISDGDGNPLPSHCYQYYVTTPVHHEQIDVLVDAPPEELILSYHSRGHQFSERVLIPAPEVLPDGWEVSEQ